MAQPLPDRPARRHDLDALRAVAMLLGIVLHVILSFAPQTAAAWPVTDVSANGVYDLLMAAIHGFRMPLFFLLSGFFTAMLWRSRGLKALLTHRARRIGLPLFVGMFTIVPATWAAFIFVAIAGELAAKPDDPSAPPTQAEQFWEAVNEGQLEPVRAYVDSGADLNLRHPGSGATPLGSAIALGHDELVAYLLESGADPDFGSRDQDTPLHVAAFFGRNECCRLLLAHGANPTATNRLGSTPLDNARVDWVTTRFFSELIGIEVSRTQVEEGRAALIPMLEQAAGADGAPPPPASSALISGLYFMLVYFPVFHHLWFLWYLCWLIPAFAVYAWLADRFAWRGPPAAALLSPLRWLWLVPATLVPQWMMGELETLYGPDTSTGLIPAPHILLYYALFFFVGTWYYDAHDGAGRLTRGWRWTLPVALLVVFPLGYEVTLGPWGLRDAWLDPAWFHPLASLLQVLYVWLMVFGSMGLFAAVYSDESRVMRYLSDSSYWLYLAHLPVVIIGQYLIAGWVFPSLGKIGLLLGVVSALLLLSYDWLVRYTWIGRMLNGPRTRPRRSEQPVAVDAA